MRTSTKLATLLSRGGDPYTVTPTQTVGSELLVNGDFSDGTGTFPNGWTVEGSGSGNSVTNTNPDGSAGSGAARMVGAGTARIRIRQNSKLTVGQTYFNEWDMSAYSSGAFTYQDGANYTAALGGSAARVARGLLQAGNVDILIQSNTSPAQDATVNYASCKPITLNPEMTVPSANMKMTTLFSLPASPRVGDQVRLSVRASNYSAGNHLYAWLWYNLSSVWEVRLYSVASYALTQLIGAVTSLGTVNGLRVNCNGNSISMFTTTDSGSNWTQRGSTVTHSTYNTATKANVIWTPDFTMTQLKYEAAT